MEHTGACDHEGSPVKMGKALDRILIERLIDGLRRSPGGIARKHVTDLRQAPVQFSAECLQARH